MARQPKTKNGVTPTLKKETKPDKFTTDQMIAALTATKGMRTLAARQLGCDYKTVVRYITEYPEVAEAAETAKENMLDTIELKAYDRCMKDDTTMIIFMLKTQGKARGYIEKTLNVNVDLSKLSDDELRAIAEGKG